MGTCDILEWCEMGQKTYTTLFGYFCFINSNENLTVLTTEVSSWGDFSIDDSHFILHICIIMRFIHCSYVIHKSITLLLLQAIVITTVGCLWRLLGQHRKTNFDALILNFLNIFLSYLIISFCCIEDDCWGERYIGKYRAGQCIRAAYGLLYFEEQSYWFMNIKSQVSTALCCLSVLASTRISGAILDTKWYTASLSILAFPWPLRALFFPMAILLWLNRGPNSKKPRSPQTTGPKPHQL